MKPIDRSKDITAPPYDSTIDCDTCGKKMVVRIDDKSGKFLKPPQIAWYWWCGGCDKKLHGGNWTPVSEEEYHFNRWEKANEHE